MKKNFLIFSVLVFNAICTYGQGCNDVLLQQKAGIWKEAAKGAVSGIAAIDLAREKSTLTALHSMIKAKYSPMGVVGEVSFAYNRPYPNMPANSYYYSILALNYWIKPTNLHLIKLNHC